MNAWVRWRRERPRRLLLSLAASLVLMVMAAHADFRQASSRFDGLVVRAQERIPVDLLAMVPATQLQERRLPTAVLGAPVEETHTPLETPLPNTAPSAWQLDPSAHRPARMVGASVHLPATLQRAAPRGAVDLPAQLAAPGVEHAPQLRTETIDLNYPEDARRAAVEGRVMLRFVVEPDGRARAIEVVESLHPSCDQEAVRAVSQARFVPGYHRGHAVSSQTVLAIRFTLMG